MVNVGPIADLQRELQDSSELVLAPDEPLAPRTTLRIGGPAELLVRVATEAALMNLLDRSRFHGIACRILGLGSNVLIPDEGLQGVTAVLEGRFLELDFREVLVSSGAGLPLARVARAAIERGLAGLEALAGFPSTVGGAVVMNAGCYGVEIRDVLESAVVVRPGGQRQVLAVGDLSPGYRSTNLQGSDAVVTRATFRLRPDDTGEAAIRLQELNRRRRESMPSGRPNAGSAFRNPPGDFAGRLIEACGLKGTRRGGAEISREHANVIVNNGEGSAREVFELLLLAHRAVRERFQVRLEPEWILAGSLRQEWDTATAEIG